jgi:hypothetical protein
MIVATVMDQHQGDVEMTDLHKKAQGVVDVRIFEVVGREPDAKPGAGRRLA